MATPMDGLIYSLDRCRPGFMDPRQSARIALPNELLRETGIAWYYHLRNADPDLYHAVSKREAADVRDICLPTNVSFREASRESSASSGSRTLFSLVAPLKPVGEIWPASL